MDLNEIDELRREINNLESRIRTLEKLAPKEYAVVRQGYLYPLAMFDTKDKALKFIEDSEPTWPLYHEKPVRLHIQEIVKGEYDDC